MRRTLQDCRKLPFCPAFWHAFALSTGFPGYVANPDDH